MRQLKTIVGTNEDALFESIGVDDVRPDIRAGGAVRSGLTGRCQALRKNAPAPSF